MAVPASHGWNFKIITSIGYYDKNQTHMASDLMPITTKIYIDSITMSNKNFLSANKKIP